MKITTVLQRAVLASVLTSLLLFSTGLEAQYKVLYSFQPTNDGSGPNAVTLDAHGNLYGTTFGSDQGSGPSTVFKLTPNGDGTWTETIVYRFAALSGVNTPVVIDSHGNLYGETPGSGRDYGSVFELTPSGGNWIYRTPYTFAGYPDGAYPEGGLNLFGNQLFGATSMGGARNIGMVFELNPKSATQWSEVVPHSFMGGTQGSHPQGAMTMDPSGDIYGIAGGGNGNETVAFKLIPNHRGAGWQMQNLFVFQYPYGDPNGNLLMDPAGNLYGTSTFDGYVGTVYELSPGANGIWSYKTLYSFTDRNGDGGFPNPGLVMDAAGNLYGTTQQGGTHDPYGCYYYGCGTIFKLTPSSDGNWTESVVYAFDDTNGNSPRAGLAQDGAGNLYGTTWTGGAAEVGVVFEFTP